MQRTIGQVLRTAREARGLTFLDVSHETRIPPNRLQQLEDDNFAAFGSMAYAKSFLKNYSRYLGVDASEVVDGLPVPVLGGPSDYRYLTETQGAWIERHERPHGRSVVAKAGRSPVPTLAGMFAVFVIAGALLGNHLVERHKSVAGTSPKAQGEYSRSSGDDSDFAASPTLNPEGVSHVDAGGPGEVGRGIPGSERTGPELPHETTVRRAVLPSSIPAPVGPNTPVRRPEIVR